MRMPATIISGGTAAAGGGGVAAAGPFLPLPCAEATPTMPGIDRHKIVPTTAVINGRLHIAIHTRVIGRSSSDSRWCTRSRTLGAGSCTQRLHGALRGRPFQYTV